MREENINKMNFKELREEVQLLRDELAIFKRKYEDAIYNLDGDNLGKSFTIAQDNLKAQIKITADALKSTVTKEDLETKLTEYSTIEQTAGSISSYVQRQMNLKKAELITNIAYATDPSKIYKIQTYNTDGTIVVGETYYYYNSISQDWEVLSGDTIYTMFEQTEEGFKLRGNTVIDGTATITRNLVLEGNVTWDMTNSPVLTQYSSDGYFWHSPMADGDKYMRMSFDGSKSWSTTTKVVGSDANVTPENVFAALTDEGAKQGLFSAFYEEENKLFINAEYISTDIAQVASSLNIGDPNITDEKMLSFNNIVKLRGEGTYFYVSCERAYFKDLDELDNEPLFYINDKQVATQSWVKNQNYGGGSSVAVFG
ncbi:MAG: hypothetical protein IKK94_03360 [Clostridia bacterium]|nr:hypothetical protein [Clostridia bacterium]